MLSSQIGVEKIDQQQAARIEHLGLWVTIREWTVYIFCVLKSIICIYLANNWTNECKVLENSSNWYFFISYDFNVIYRNK